MRFRNSSHYLGLQSNLLHHVPLNSATSKPFDALLWTPLSSITLASNVRDFPNQQCTCLLLQSHIQ